MTDEAREEINRELRENIYRITENLISAYRDGGDPPYSFADVAIDEEAKAYGITVKQYSNAINAVIGKSAVAQKYALATLSGMSGEQKAYVSESVLHNNKSFEEWGPVYSTLSKHVKAESLEAMNEIVKDMRSDPYTKPNGETDSIDPDSTQERRGEGKSASLKKKEAIDKAYPNAAAFHKQGGAETA